MAKAAEKKTEAERRGADGAGEGPLRPRRRRARRAWSPTRSAACRSTEARTLLAFSSRGAARDLLRLLDSAAANAEANHELVADDLRIAAISVDEGPTLKRWRARARGRATPIHKRTSHLSVALTPTTDA